MKPPGARTSTTVTTAVGSQRTPRRQMGAGVERQSTSSDRCFDATGRVWQARQQHKVQHERETQRSPGLGRVAVALPDQGTGFEAAQKQGVGGRGLFLERRSCASTHTAASGPRGVATFGVVADRSQPPAGGSTGVIRLVIQGGWTTFGWSPSVAVNGYSYSCSFGVQDIWVWAGRNRLVVDLTFPSGFGSAVLDVDVAPGQVVPIWYAPPWAWPFPGRMGHTPQTRSGGLFLASVMGMSLFGLLLLSLTAL